MCVNTVNAVHNNKLTQLLKNKKSKINILMCRIVKGWSLSPCLSSSGRVFQEVGLLCLKVFLHHFICVLLWTVVGL